MCCSSGVIKCHHGHLNVARISSVMPVFYSTKMKKMNELSRKGVIKTFSALLNSVVKITDSSNVKFRHLSWNLKTMFHRDTCSSGTDYDQISSWLLEYRHGQFKDPSILQRKKDRKGWRNSRENVSETLNALLSCTIIYIKGRDLIWLLIKDETR